MEFKEISNSEWRRLLKLGALELNGEKNGDILKIGKRRFVKFKEKI